MLTNINDLIEYGNENDFLDFKATEHPTEKHHELIKNVLAFANGHFKGDKSIIIGIKKKWFS